MFKKLLTVSAIAVLSLSAHAQEDDHGHGDEEHGDILGSVSGPGSQIVVSGGEPLIGGGYVFETDFADAEFGDYATDAPGFDVELNEGEFLSLEVVGNLQFWDDGLESWVTAPTGAGSGQLDILTIGQNLLTSVTGTGTGANPSIVGVGEADADNEVHVHLLWAINSDAPIGAYLLEFALRGYDSEGGSEIYGASDSFYIAYNNGFDHFHEAVEALGIAEVPVPAAAWFMLTALGSLVTARRLRR